MIGFIVAGLVIGALARLIKPGRQRLGLLATLLVGVGASVIGSDSQPAGDRNHLRAELPWFRGGADLRGGDPGNRRGERRN